MPNKIEYQTSFTVALDKCAITGVEPADGRAGTSSVVTVYGNFLADAVDVTFPEERVSTAILDVSEHWVRARLNISPDSVTGRHAFQILTLRGVLESNAFSVYFQVEPSGSARLGGGGGNPEEEGDQDYVGGFDLGIGSDLL